MRGTLAAIDKPVNPAGSDSARRIACRSAWGGLALGVLTLWACQKSAPIGSSAAPGAGGSSAQDEYRRPAVLVAALGLSQGQKVAEVGAGGGYLTLHLARAVGPQGRVVATDVDAGALAALRKRAHELPQVETRLVLPAQSGLEVGRYDLILLAEVVHLLPQPEKYLGALFASLAPHGRIVVSGRLDRRERLEQAVAAAHLQLVDVQVDLPGQFVTELRQLPGRRE